MPAVAEKKITKKKFSSEASVALAQPKIFLVGMMGAGKSFWAEKLKKKLRIPAYDLDALIEMMEEKTIAEIFDEDGEEFFRKAESKMLRLFAEKKQFILSCGGGAACYNNNMSWMNKHGITIWIDEPAEILAERLSAEKMHRPSIRHLDDKGIFDWVSKKLAERQTFYGEAAHRIGGDKLSETTFIKIIKENA